MEIIRDRQFHSFSLPESSRAWVALGVFDGFHRGHQALLNECVRAARACHGTPCVLTFAVHPTGILGTGSFKKVLSTVEERIIAFEKAGVEYLLLPEFTLDFARQSPEDFIKNVLVGQLHAAGVVTGFNYRFGKKRAGDARLLAEQGRNFNFETKAIPAVEFNGCPVSSTKVREALQNGLLDEANEMLGYPFSLLGKVVHGDSRGREIGFPTANLALLRPSFVPPGVYSAKVWIGETLEQTLDRPGLDAMLYIGSRPTFHKDHGRITVEVHLMDWTETLYGQMLRVQPLSFLRKEELFETKMDLAEQIRQDIQRANEVFQPTNEGNV